MRTIVIDDEFYGREFLKQFIEEHSDLLVLDGEASNVSEAYDLIIQKNPDLIFLDIQLDDETGFDLLNKFDKIDFEIIFVTAYNQHALKALKMSAVDYVMKPVDGDELLKGVLKAKERSKGKNSDQNIQQLLKSVTGLGKAQKLSLPTLNGYDIVQIDRIIRLEADGSYTRFFIDNHKSYLVTRPIKDYEEKLLPQGFCRIHRSHIINLDHVVSYEKGRGGYVRLSDGSSCEVSHRKKENFLKLINQL